MERREWQPTPAFLPGEFKDRGTWRATVHGVAKGQTRLSDFHFNMERSHFYLYTILFRYAFTNTYTCINIYVQSQIISLILTQNLC